MFEQKFAFSLVVFCDFILIFFKFIRIDFFNGFTKPFIVYSRPSFFCLNQISLPRLVVFCSLLHFDIDFKNFFLDFFTRLVSSCRTFFRFTYFAAFSTFCVKSF